jgi:hypothetical protein
MNSGLVHSELNYNFRLFAKTISSSAAWGFDRFRLFTSKWHTKIQVRRLDGSVVATQSFAPDGAFEHTFSFDLSGNVTNEEYSVYIAGVAVGQNFNQAYAWPTGYSATTGKNAELTYWDFSQVNIVFSGTTGRIRFENNPIAAMAGLNLLAASEVNFANCQLDAETLADAIIGLDNSGISNGTFTYSGNLAAPAERALAAYNNLKDVKAWVMNGEVPVGVTYDAKTSPYMTTLGITNDPTVYFGGTLQETTGTKWWSDIDQLIIDLRAATGVSDLSTVFAAVYPYYGGTANRVKFNLLNPTDSDAAHRIEHFGSWIHNETGSLVNGANTYTATHIIPSVDMSANGNGLIWCFGQENADTAGIFIHCYNSNTQKIAAYLGSGKWVVSANGPNIDSGITGKKGVWGLVKQDSVTAPFFKNKVKVYTHDGGGTLPTWQILECVNMDVATGLSLNSAFLGNQTLLSRVYVKAALTDQQIINVSTALENFESRVGRKTW